AANHGGRAALLSPRGEVFGQQRHLWITFFQILNDRRRLNQQRAFIGTQGRHATLRVDGQIRRLTVLATGRRDQVDRQRLIVQPLEGQRDAHPVGRGRT